MTWLKCFMGFHAWRWSWREGDLTYASAPPPARARCIHCATRYKKITGATRV